MNGHGSTEHPTRKVLYQFIVENPGASFQLILKILKIPEGTLRYHLQQLDRSNKIIKEKKGKNLFYYSAFQKEHQECETNVELSEKQEFLLDLIRDDPGITRKELMIRSKLDRKNMNYTLRRLKDLKLIWNIETKKGDGFEVISRERLMDEMFKIAPPGGISCRACLQQR